MKIQEIAPAVIKYAKNNPFQMTTLALLAAAIISTCALLIFASGNDASIAAFTAAGLEGIALPALIVSFAKSYSTNQPELKTNTALFLFGETFQYNQTE